MKVREEGKGVLLLAPEYIFRSCCQEISPDQWKPSSWLFTAWEGKFPEDRLWSVPAIYWGAGVAISAHWEGRPSLAQLTSVSTLSWKTRHMLNTDEDA